MHSDVIIAGGGFAGLACAKALARAGISVTLLERKKAPGVGMHTTGIIVGECAEEFAVPEHLTRKVTDVRLYAPSLRFVDLQSPDYFFLTTDTPGLMQYFSDEAIAAGATIIYDTSYDTGRIAHDNIEINGGAYSCDFLIGADGPRSKVAMDFDLGRNHQFLLGAEAEYSGLKLPDSNAFYCFLDQRLAYGYLGWVIPGVDVTQVGTAQRMPRRPDIEQFAGRMEGIFDFSEAKIVARRGGLIPVGGLVKPFATGNVILLGDAAGIVSPLTAGGIHTALHYGKILGEALAAHMRYAGPHPAQVLHRIYPRFYVKQGLRKAYETLAPNWLLDVTLTNPLFKILASTVFFKKEAFEIKNLNFLCTRTKNVVA